ncbi:hypothetical protein CH259_00475 [Rhodococcus sp. 05-2254-4]|nr:hypothetical protein CH259_00475 [Rhodococcus sp. 05-2254-4]OZE47349.1 hypothetical protein CH261_10235 [Rhodococcus sp. 05-2254-3]OZE47648.1 hypothetical protein CH283_18350 [Rhodococcus sp. 05-2254-2]
MGRNVQAIVHRPDGSQQRVLHTPDSTWRYENEAGEPTFIENPTDRWSLGADDIMVHAVKSPNTMYAVMGASQPSVLLRAYDAFPPSALRGFDDQRFAHPSAPRAVTVRGRAGWEVTARDEHANEPVTYVFDAELGVAVRWQRGDEWMELEKPTLDAEFDPALFIWTGPSRPVEDDIAQHQREHEERQRALAEIPQALPTWLPITTNTQSLSGDPRTGELSLSISGHSPQFTLRRWVTAIGEHTLEWPNDVTPERYRQALGEWTYEIRSYQEIDPNDCARIVESIVPVEPPERDPADINAELAAEESDRREKELLATLGTGEVLTNHLDGESLLIRTDFTDDDSWRNIAVAAMAPVPQGDGTEFAAYLTCIDNRDYDGLTVDGLLDLVGDPPPYYAFLVDAETVTNPEMPIVAVYTGPDYPERPRGKTFRVIPTEMCSVENNLSIANMDFESFADSADDDDGIFRGFPAPPPQRFVGVIELVEAAARNISTPALSRFHLTLIKNSAIREHHVTEIDDLRQIYERMSENDYSSCKLPKEAALHSVCT